MQLPYKLITTARGSPKREDVMRKYGAFQVGLKNIHVPYTAKSDCSRMVWIGQQTQFYLSCDHSTNGDSNFW